jgi:hypothetical protein
MLSVRAQSASRRLCRLTRAPPEFTYSPHFSIIFLPLNTTGVSPTGIFDAGLALRPSRLELQSSPTENPRAFFVDARDQMAQCVSVQGIALEPTGSPVDLGKICCASPQQQLMATPGEK